MAERGSFDVVNEVDTTIPSVARVYDYYLGGGANFKADREFAHRILKVFPGVRAQAVANRQWQHKAVHWAAEQGVRQFLDLGAGIPTVNPTHEVARTVHPDAKVVYVDNEAVAVAHGEAQLRDDPGCRMVHAELQDVDTVIERAGELLDFSEPVGMVMAAILHVIPDADDPHGILDRYHAAIAPGSYLLISHATTEGDESGEMASVEREYGSAAIANFYPRTRAQLTELVSNYELMPPGVVRGAQWHPDEAGEVNEQDVIWCLAARKN